MKFAVRLTIFMALFQSAGNVLAENKLSVYTKLDGEKITFSDGSGNVNLGCRESYCASVAGKYSHPHNIQQHKKSYVQLNADGTGDYELWSYSGSEMTCKGKIAKWGHLYKGEKLVSPNILFIASRDSLGKDGCEFAEEAKIYTDFNNGSGVSSFKYFTNEGK